MIVIGNLCRNTKPFLPTRSLVKTVGLVVSLQVTIISQAARQRTEQKITPRKTARYGLTGKTAGLSLTIARYVERLMPQVEHLKIVRLQTTVALNRKTKEVAVGFYVEEKTVMVSIKGRLHGGLATRAVCQDSSLWKMSTERVVIFPHT